MSSEGTRIEIKRPGARLWAGGWAVARLVRVLSSCCRRKGPQEERGGTGLKNDAAGHRRGGADEAPAPTDLAGAGYNAQGLPTGMALEGGPTISYRYTAGGQRTYKKAVEDPATRYVRDGAVTVAVVTGGSLEHWNVTLPGGEVIGRKTEGGGSRYYMKDHLGSIRVVIDGSPDWVEQRDYYPFGLRMPGWYERGSPPTQEDFTGHVKDEATGLHYAGARYYSSAFGRWTTTDPILGTKGPRLILSL